jgi:hypothetical protein
MQPQLQPEEPVASRAFICHPLQKMEFVLSEESNYPKFNQIYKQKY